jgi:hypothetical protein
VSLIGPRFHGDLGATATFAGVNLGMSVGFGAQLVATLQTQQFFRWALKRRQIRIDDSDPHLVHVGYGEIIPFDNNRVVFTIDIQIVGECKFESLRRLEFALGIPGALPGTQVPGSKYQRSKENISHHFPTVTPATATR